MIAVTTHSRTKRLLLGVPMLLAGGCIQRELEADPGCERYANVIAGLRDFWTLTIWKDPDVMRSSMRSGSHAKVMLRQPYWLQSYWGMRWQPGGRSSGEWEGDPWAWPEAEQGLPRSPVEPRRGALPPWMKAALGETVPLEQRRIAGSAGATFRLRVPPWRIPAAVRDLRRLRSIAAGDPDLFKVSLGIGTGAALYLLVISRSRGAIERLRSHPLHALLQGRWGDRLWWSTWEPEAEFGHWDSDKLRDGLLAHEEPAVDRRLPIGAASPRWARDIVRRSLDGIDPETLETLELLTSELVGNIVRHAGLQPTDWIGLRVVASDDRVRLEVIDQGRRFEPRVPLAKSYDDESGWGLYILDQKVDRWGIIENPPDRHIWFELDLPPAMADLAQA